ncbi:TadE/TadG family type IV pilus assembly protein [Sphingomonas baiyangensis]|nr:TadE/TadG family type IV pilus assembly protein [Sphingomonas baiyangensis]
MVEFALLAPLLIVLLMGMLAFGQYFLVAHSLQQLANDAARATVAGLDAAERDALARGSVAHGLARLAIADAQAITTEVDEEAGRVIVTLAADTRALSLLRAAAVPLPGPVIERRAIARAGGVP